MQTNKQAFTLIELLVVVLIIGILAAVALPQYQLAVDKARMIELLTATKSVKDAQEIYYLANGKYATNWYELDIDWPGTINGTILTQDSGLTLRLQAGGPSTPTAVYATDSRMPGILLIVSYEHSAMMRGRYCYADRNSVRANKLCKNLTNSDAVGHPNNYSRYDF